MIIKTGLSFEWNEDRLTVFLKLTDFTKIIVFKFPLKMIWFEYHPNMSYNFQKDYHLVQIILRSETLYYWACLCVKIGQFSLVDSKDMMMLNPLSGFSRWRSWQCAFWPLANQGKSHFRAIQTPLNPNWHELWKQGKCSPLAPPRVTFYKTQ